MRRVSYHQSGFDLLDIQPRESPQAREMIGVCEVRTGQRLPEAVRQWYLVDGVVVLREDRDRPAWARNQEDRLWYNFSNMDCPESLEAVLRQFAEGRTEGMSEEAGQPPGSVRVMTENQAVCAWYCHLDGSVDPPVIVDEDFDTQSEEVVYWVPVADRFSTFVFDWFARFYFEKFTPLAGRTHDDRRRIRPPRAKPYLNGLWLHAPQAEPLAPPYLDFLIENFTEDSRQEITPGAMQYRFRGDHGRLSVTTDGYAEEGGVSAWWLHADSEEDLFQLAKRVWWFGDLPTALRAWSKPARSVMDRLRAEDRQRIDRPSR